LAVVGITDHLLASSFVAIEEDKLQLAVGIALVYLLVDLAAATLVG